MLLLILGVGCTHSPEQLCAGKGPESLILGSGSGSEFVPFEDGDEVEIITPPQGGYGISIRASTLGLVGNSNVELALETFLGEESIGQFDWGLIQLYCQDDGSSLMWGAAAPIDEAYYPEEEDLDALIGETVTMVATVTDQEGDVATGEADVTLVLAE